MVILAARSSDKSFNCRRALIGHQDAGGALLDGDFNDGDRIEDGFDGAAQV